MKQSTTRRRFLAVAGSTLALAGCVGNGDDSNTGGTSDDSNTGGNGDDMSGNGGDTGGNGDDMSDAGGWQSIQLTDVTTDESFTLSEIEQPVVVHTFATWCSKCRSQQQKIKSLYEQRGDEITFLDMTIDENDDASALRSHAQQNDFGWRFAVSPAEVTRQLVDEFGQSVAVAPQSPVIIVCPDGSTQTLGKGASAAEIGDAVDEHCQ